MSSYATDSSCGTLCIKNHNEFAVSNPCLTDDADFQHRVAAFLVGQQVEYLHERIAAKGRSYSALMSGTVGGSLLLLKLETSDREKHYDLQTFKTPKKNYEKIKGSYAPQSCPGDVRTT